MRFVNDTSFHLRMAALLVFALFLDHLASEHLSHWSSPRIGILPFAMGLVWVGLYAYHVCRTLRDRVRVLEDRVDRLTHRADAYEDHERERRSLPPM